jgi:4,5-DOPA dioxygenase extradiol
MNLHNLKKLSDDMNKTVRMPALFLGHGSPMNAIEENEFVQGFRDVEKTIPKPQAVLCISAHWETKGTFVTAMESPPTIHDFGGFPEELFRVQYPAPGDPLLAGEIQQTVKTVEVESDFGWGFDHGSWSVIRHLYPMADIPIIQMSLDYYQDPRYHYSLAQELAVLRDKGVLVIGSGNLVHNLRLLQWEKMKEVHYAFNWAVEAGEKLKQLIMQKNHDSLVAFRSLGKAVDLAVPTYEHYLPLLYILALQNDKDEIRIFNDQYVGGSVGMTSVKIG